jgi:molecular chaperone DnaJ
MDEKNYKILGLDNGASEAQVREAYKKLQDIYNPDKFNDIGQKKYAEEKLEEIDKAYSELLTQFNGGNFAYDYRENTYSTGREQKRYSSTRFESKEKFYLYIRKLIQDGKFALAQDELDRYPDPENGEWNFLKGSALYYSGYIDMAYTFFQEAVYLQPENSEYSNIFNRLSSAGKGEFSSSSQDKNLNTDKRNECGENDSALCWALVCLSCMRRR